MLTKIILPALCLIAGLANGSETIPFAEATKILNDLSSFQASLTANPTYVSIEAAAISDLGGSAAASSFFSAIALTASAHTYGFSEFATNPNVLLTARPTAWETALASSVRSALDAEETSIVVAQASIVKQDLGISAAAPAVGAKFWGIVGAIVGVITVVGVVL